MDGYVLVDCGGLELTSKVEQTIPGLFNRTQEAYKTNKFIIAYNCNWYGDKMSPIAVRVTPYGSQIVASTATYHVIISPNDAVIIMNDLDGRQSNNDKLREE